MASRPLPELTIGNDSCAEIVSVRAESSAGLADRITVEHGLYATIVLAGAFVRLADLANWPLGIPEAVHAWSAWQVTESTGQYLTLLPDSAALEGMLTGLFFLGANQDFWVRFVPAVAGTVLLALPWWWRAFLGRWGALWLALLFAISPWLVANSRIADGTALALTAFFTALTGLQQLVIARRELSENAQRRWRWSMITAASVGFLATTGVLAWSLGLVLALFVWAYWRDLRTAFVWSASVVLACPVAFLLGATGGLLRLDGFGLVAGSLGVWLRRVQGTHDPAFAYLSGQYSSMWPLIRLLVDQPLLAIFGVGGLIHLGIRREGTDGKWPVVLWSWLAWAALLILLPGRGPRDLLVLLLPLAFGTAYALAALCNAIPAQESRRDGLAVIGTLVVLLVSFAFWAAGLVASREFDAEAAQASLIVLSLVVLILFAYGWWASWPEAYWMGALILAAWLLLATVSSAWHLAHRQDLARPDGFMAEIAHPEVRQLVEDIETLSAQRSGDSRQLALSVGYAAPPKATGGDVRFAPVNGPHPVLGWYLRNLRNVTWSPQADVSVGNRPSPLAITFPGPQAGDGEMGEGVPEGYVGSEYGLAATWLPADLAKPNETPAGNSAGWDGAVARFREAWRIQIQPWLRWAVYRRSDVPPQIESVILWANPSQ